MGEKSRGRYPVDDKPFSNPVGTFAAAVALFLEWHYILAYLPLPYGILGIALTVALYEMMRALRRYAQRKGHTVLGRNWWVPRVPKSVYVAISVFISFLFSMMLIILLDGVLGTGVF